MARSCRMRLIRHFCLSALLLVCVAAAPAQAPAKPYLLHLCGIGGYMRIDRNMLQGLKQAGLDAEVEHYDWTVNDPGLHALVAYDRNRQQAKVIAQKIIEHYRKY